MAKGASSRPLAAINARLLKDSRRLAEETATSQLLLDHRLADSLIEYGRRMAMPEALVLAARILRGSPVDAMDATAERDEANRIRQLLDEALKMQPKDKVLSALAARIDEEPAPAAESAAAPESAVLEAGPKLWVVRIDKGKHFRLNPDPRFAAHRAARVLVTVENNSILGLTVRRTDLTTEKRWVGMGRISAAWNSGIREADWDIRVFNPQGPDGLKVRIETS